MAHLSRQQRKFSTNRLTFRSGLEEKIAKEITFAGHAFKFEAFKIPYIRPETSHTYCPDFFLANGIIVETKGMLQTEDKKKMVLVKKQHPDLDIRFVFSNANARIAKKSRTTYAMWADKNGFPWAHRSIPKEWLDETVNLRSVAAVRKLLVK